MKLKVTLPKSTCGGAAGASVASTAFLKGFFFTVGVSLPWDKPQPLIHYWATQELCQLSLHCSMDAEELQEGQQDSACTSMDDPVSGPDPPCSQHCHHLILLTHPSSPCPVQPSLHLLPAPCEGLLNMVVCRWGCWCTGGCCDIPTTLVDSDGFTTAAKQPLLVQCWLCWWGNRTGP